MAYYIDAQKISLFDLRRRIEETDLVPSRVCLMQEIQSHFETLERHQIHSLADLREASKTPNRISALANKTGIDIQYLTLLRREVEGYFPKPLRLKAFSWLPHSELERLEQAGIRTTNEYFEALEREEHSHNLADETGISKEVLNELRSLSNLTRVQWISPIAARMLMDAGYCHPSAVAMADSQRLCDDLDAVNKKSHYFKGKIGLRDVCRLIHAARYLVEAEKP